MANIRTELESIKAFVSDVVASDVKVAIENTPVELVPKVMVIELTGERSFTAETASHNRIDSLVQLTYYGSSKLDCLQTMEAVVEKLANARVIPINNSDRHIKYRQPSMTGAFSTNTTGVFVIACMLATNIRSLVPQESYEFINELTTDVRSDN